MKSFPFFIFSLFLGITLSGYSQNIPDPPMPHRMVNDFVGLLSDSERQVLETKLLNYQDTTSTQIYVVIVPSFNGYDKAQFASELGEKWKIGQPGKDNGVVLLIKPKSKNESGEVFIATGYGTESALTDAVCRRIIEQNMIPYFRENYYFDGIQSGIEQMIYRLSGEYTSDSDSESAVPDLVIVILLVVGIIILASFSKKNTGNGNPRNFGGGMFFPPTGGGFGSGGGFSGGFSGGGGGRFGGGGAGGRW